MLKNINKYNYDLFNGTAENQLPEYLNIHDGDVLGYIEIPSINIKLPIYYGTSVDTLKKRSWSFRGDITSCRRGKYSFSFISSYWISKSKALY